MSSFSIEKQVPLNQNTLYTALRTDKIYTISGEDLPISFSRIGDQVVMTWDTVTFTLPSDNSNITIGTMPSAYAPTHTGDSQNYPVLVYFGVVAEWDEIWVSNDLVLHLSRFDSSNFPGDTEIILYGGSVSWVAK